MQLQSKMALNLRRHPPLRQIKLSPNLHHQSWNHHGTLLGGSKNTGQTSLADSQSQSKLLDTQNANTIGPVQIRASWVVKSQQMLRDGPKWWKRKEQWCAERENIPSISEWMKSLWSGFKWRKGENKGCKDKAVPVSIRNGEAVMHSTPSEDGSPLLCLIVSPEGFQKWELGVHERNMLLELLLASITFHKSCWISPLLITTGHVSNKLRSTPTSTGWVIFTVWCYRGARRAIDPRDGEHSLGLRRPKKAWFWTMIQRVLKWDWDAAYMNMNQNTLFAQQYSMFCIIIIYKLYPLMCSRMERRKSNLQGEIGFENCPLSRSLSRNNVLTSDHRMIEKLFDKPEGAPNCRVVRLDIPNKSPF